MESGKEFFVKKYESLGWKFSEVKPRQSIRVNTLKISNEALAKRLQGLGCVLEKVPFLKNGYSLIRSDFSLGAAIEYLLGYYYIQEAASQKVCELLNPSPGELVLDLAAAPGGKTTHLAQLMGNKGVIVAVDMKPPRLIALKNNIERMGVSNTIVYNLEGEHCEKLGLVFDKVLLDAPCSGNFTQEDGWFEKRNMEDIRGIAKTQRDILRAAFRVLKEGGELVYKSFQRKIEKLEKNKFISVKKTSGGSEGNTSIIKYATETKKLTEF